MDKSITDIIKANQNARKIAAAAAVEEEQRLLLSKNGQVF
jgi:hypothetical protein